MNGEVRQGEWALFGNIDGDVSAFIHLYKLMLWQQSLAFR